jgi:site-specific recombinase XerD
VARDASPATCRSYAFDLLRWWRFLASRDRPWTRACRNDVRDFVLWLRTSDNPQRRPGRAGGVNPRTDKPNLVEGYAPATINHALSVISIFYQFAAEQGEGPVVNPVPEVRQGSSKWRNLALEAEFVAAASRALQAAAAEPDPKVGRRRAARRAVRSARLRPRSSADRLLPVFGSESVRAAQPAPRRRRLGQQHDRRRVQRQPHP